MSMAWMACWHGKEKTTYQVLIGSAVPRRVITCTSHATLFSRVIPHYINLHVGKDRLREGSGLCLGRKRTGTTESQF